MSSLNFFKLTILFIALLSVINCHSGHGTIVTFQTKVALQKEMVSEIRQVSNHWNVTRAWDFGIAEAETTRMFYSSKITLHDFTIKRVEMSLDLINITTSETNSDYRVTVSGGSIFKVVLNFKYNYTWFTSGVGEGEIDVSSLFTSLDRVYVYNKNENKTERQIKNITANLESDFSSVLDFKLVIGDYSDDANTLELAKKAFGQLTLTQKYLKLHELFDYEFDKFYEDYHMRRVFMETSFPRRDFLLSYASEHTPVTTADGDIVFYYDGQYQDIGRRNLQTLEDNEDNYNLGSNKAFGGHIDEIFNKTDGNFQVLLHQSLLSNMYAHLSKDAQADFSITNRNLPNGTEFTLDVGTLGNIYPGKL